ncbi:hypothetical protein H632_c20p1 [Helicosporidium sp. ATCC 50920]|nr:hypothetical protein H632_c20p1 [Helicosporidium sp. ATCC 50920]|eukprot:KDD77096.1 hypothetical protein H632_c20p1 [Helicosporidium sp. ATCC 50920]
MVDAAERAAADEVPKHLGALISGSEADQVEASKSLRALCDKRGQFVHQAVADSNGVPVLLIMLDAKDATVHRNCIHVLCTIGQSASVRTAIMDKEGSMRKLVDAALLLVLSEARHTSTPDTLQLTRIFPDALKLQAGAAIQLARIAALPARPQAVTTALAEVALPHACEVLHEQDYQQSEGADATKDSDASLEHTVQQKLCGNCAVLIAVLSCEDVMVCELIVRHTAQLSKVVQTLVAFSQCTVAQRLLETAHAYALGIRPIPKNMLENVAVAQSAAV